MFIMKGSGKYAVQSGSEKGSMLDHPHHNVYCIFEKKYFVLPY